MKRVMSICGVLIFFGLIILGSYYFFMGKTITRATEWAKGKIVSLKEGEYDVIVVGSDPEGITAALSAARSGAKVVLLGKEDGPGGLLTYGMLNTLDMSRNSDKELLTRGIFEEFYNSIGATESFDVEEVKSIFNEMIDNEKNLEYRKENKFIEPILDGNTIIGVIVEDKLGNRNEVKGKRIIDATQDGDVCAAAGVPYYVGMEDINRIENMAATLVLRVGGVEWKELEKDIKRYKKETGSLNCDINESTAWGFGDWCYDKYKPLEGHENMQLRGPNFGLQNDGSILINALQIFDVDGLDENEKAKAIEEGKKEAENVVKYLKSILTSFENAELLGTAEELYIRETRHIKGEYTLKASDICGNKNFWDKIALSSYPMDIQATPKMKTGIVIASPNQYSIPLRCTVPQEIDNLFIVSRAASYSSVAAGSARVVPTGMAVGESVGIAAVYTIYKDITPRELTLSKSKVKQYQGILKSQNVYIPEYNGVDPNAETKGYEKIKKLIDLGMLSGGYNNDFSFDKEASYASLCNAMVNALQRGGKEKYDLNSSSRITRFYSAEKLTGGAAARVVVQFFEKYNEPDKVVKLTSWSEEEFKEKQEERLKKIEKECWEIAKNEGYFSEDFKIDDLLTNREVLIIAVDTIERYIGRELGLAE